MLAQLGDLDPGLDRDAPRATGQAEPGRDRIFVPPEATEQAPALDDDAFLGPGRLEATTRDHFPT
jgi:hypothetical protein